MCHSLFVVDRVERARERQTAAAAAAAATIITTGVVRSKRPRKATEAISLFLQL